VCIFGLIFQDVFIFVCCFFCFPYAHVRARVREFMTAGVVYGRMRAGTCGRVYMRICVCVCVCACVCVCMRMHMQVYVSAGVCT